MLKASPYIQDLPPIPAKRYFTIGEVSDLCIVKPHVLRYWEQEFPQLSPVKKRGNRRYYQREDILIIREIRKLLYDEGFTISGACQKLKEQGHVAHDEPSINDTSFSDDCTKSELIQDLIAELEALDQFLAEDDLS